MSIVIEQLTKRYGAQEALRGVDLQIERGMFGLLGPNGAGKTTLLRILATLLRPSSGRVVVDSFDLRSRAERNAVRARLGYLPQDLGLYPEMTGRGFLDYMGLLKCLYDRAARHRQIAALLDVVNLTAVADHLTKTYSGGMKRRLGIAQALLGDPQMLVIDEPTAGLDPEERIRLRTLLTRLAENRTVILSTHVVEDISQTCDRLAVLDGGKLIFHGRTRDLTTAAEGHTWQFTAAPDFSVPAELQVIAALPHPQGTLYHIVGQPPAAAADIQPLAPTLEDGYVWLRQQRGHRVAT